MSERQLVEFVGQAATLLPPPLRARLAPEVARVVAALAPDREPLAVTVGRCFAGYSADLDNRVALGVEVRYPEGSETHILKVGRADKVEPDVAGWRACTADRVVASRVFVPVRAVPLDPPRAAVVYRDAYTLFGPDRGQDDENRPRSLEQVAEDAVLHGKVSAESVERAIAQVFTDLHRWFYPGATADAAAAAAFYRDTLHLDRPDDPAAGGVLAAWRDDPFRQALRRDAVWVLCGADRPAPGPGADGLRYVDPVEFVDWAVGDPDRAWLPPTLVGRAHGDLHPRNVLLGVRRREAEYPAVFDYGKMSCRNVLVWDFAKLETELKVRLLTRLCDEDEPARGWLLARDQGPRGPAAVPTPAGQRADRLRAALAFEERLHALTAGILSSEDAERIRPFDRPTGHPRADRLLGILLRVRKEAAVALGFERHQRQKLWPDEYYFALGVAGLLNVQWDYTVPQAEAALVSAGVALARMTPTADLLAAGLAAAAPAGPDRYPSYRVPLGFLRQCWLGRRIGPAREYVERVVLEPDPAGGLRPRAGVRHAPPLIAEAALVELEAGRAAAVEPLLKGLRGLAAEFADAETLGRVGRLFKEFGDRLWEVADPRDGFHGSPAWQLYQDARGVYEQAFALTDDYYVGVNAATLALLTDDPPAARALAARVAEVCRRPGRPPEDRVWVFATEGEAHLILGEPNRAAGFYRAALMHLDDGRCAVADVAYRQLCRLWRVLGEEAVGPVLELFETSRFAGHLPRGYFGRECRGDAKSGRLN